jgi:hypothetical protein
MIITLKLNFLVLNTTLFLNTLPRLLKKQRLETSGKITLTLVELVNTKLLKNQEWAEEKIYLTVKEDGEFPT